MNSEVLTRRKLFGGILATSALAVASDRSVAATANTHHHSSLRVLTPASSEFTARLNSLYPGLANDPAFKKIASMSYLVTNEGSRKVFAFSTHWSITTGEGKFGRTLNTMFRPKLDGSGTMVLSARHRGTKMSGNVPVLKPGKTRLVTPFFAWSPRYYQRIQSSVKWNKLLHRNAHVAFYSALAEQSPAVTVRLREAIISKKKVVARSSNALSTRYRIQRNAEHDAAVSVHKLLTTGHTDQQILSVLVKQAKGFTKDHVGKALDPTNKRQAIYYKARQRQAAVLALQIAAKGRARLHATVQRLIAVPAVKSVARTK